MGSSTGRKPSAKRRAFKRRYFTAATVAAVVIAALLISLGRFGPPSGEFSPIPVSPNGVTSPSIPTIGNSKGSPNAPVTIVMYSDFQCARCQAFALTTEKELEKAYIETGKVRLVYKHFVVYDEESMLAAQASECAAEQNKFWPYYDLLVQTRASPKEEDLTRAKLTSLAQEVGLNMTAFNTCLESEKYKEKVAQDEMEGRALGVTGSPSFFVDGLMAKGHPPFEKFQEVIEYLLGDLDN